MNTRPVFFLLAVLMLVSAGCGGSGGSGSPGPANLTGPDLDLSEAKELILNQMYIKDWNEDILPSISVYLQNSVTDAYIVCAGPAEGLDVALGSGIFYGNLEVPLIAVDGAKNDDTLFFRISVVADQSKPCPEIYTEGDGVVLAEKEVDFNGLYKTTIDMVDGYIYLGFTGRGNPDISIPEMEIAATDALTVGEIYFDDAPPQGIIPNYYLMLHIAGGNVDLVSPDVMPHMREGKIIYSWLNLAFAKTEGISTNADLQKREAYFELYKYDGDNEVLIGTTAPDYVEDLLRYAGQKLEFTNNKGYLKLRSLQ